MAARFAYRRNPDCLCAWCVNNGKNPTPGNPATLGYDIPHTPPPGPRETIDDSRNFVYNPWASAPWKKAA